VTGILALGLSAVLALLSVAVIAALAGDDSPVGMIRCWWRGDHVPQRAGPWSAYRCSVCGRVDEDLELGHPRDSGYVSPGERKAWVRDGREMRREGL
jgi:hypothetical protein